MREISTTLTQRHQVTIPAEVRRLLGLKARDKVTFAIDAQTVQLRSPRYTLESVFGSVKPATSTEEFEELSRQAKEDHVASSAAKLTRP